MPGRPPKLTFAAIAVVVAALLVAGCGGTENHTWQGEFTERLERASAAVEEAAGELRLNPDQTQGLDTLIGLGRKLDSERKSVRRLDPPAECEGVQKAGAKELNQLAYETFLHYKNGTPYLLRHLPGTLKEEIAGIGKIEHEAESCE
jgi:hypothetical protein